MQEKPSPRLERSCNHPSTEHDDAEAQRAVLGFVLNQHPAQLTICELAREIDLGGGDAVERAIRDLVGAGLLRCEGASVLATRAALHFDRLRL
jgi:hypothetical protein